MTPEETDRINSLMHWYACAFDTLEGFSKWLEENDHD